MAAAFIAASPGQAPHAVLEHPTLNVNRHGAALDIGSTDVVPSPFSACSFGMLAGMGGVAYALANRRLSSRHGATQIASTIRCAFDKELGTTMPFKYFDPLGLASDGDTGAFRRRRAAEIKNGRVAMWACMGYITPEYFRWPGYLSPSANLKFTDVPNGVAALSKVPAEGWAQIGIFIAFLELFALRQDKDRMPGDLTGAGKLGLPFFLVGAKSSPCDAVSSERSLNAELNNGRLAMLAIVGMISQNGFLGTTGASMWIPGAAFDKELGATMPFKYFDPLGLASDGDAGAFRRRRAAEIKNGRVAMWACMGYITPEYFRWPGYLSPSASLKFTDVPNGVAALSKVPAEGWAQIGIFIAFLELFALRQDMDRMPGDLTGAGRLGLPFFLVGGKSGPCDAVSSERSLNAELNNGRLAMLAIVGMISQNGFLGTTGPSMWIP